MGISKILFSTVSGLYNNINPISLSGANDVIVVRSKSGELKCSPFQLRFSKLKFTSARNQVHILVNGVLSDISMIITSEGDLFFQQEASSKMDTDSHSKIVDCFNSLEVIAETIINEKLKQLEKLTDFEQEKVQSIRNSNLKTRMTSKNFSQNSVDLSYKKMTKNFNKFSAMVNSSENYEYLIQNSRNLLAAIESLIQNDSRGARLSFSSCMTHKIDTSFEALFSAHLIRNIQDTASTVVKIEYKGSTNSLFYLSFDAFSKLYFELMICKNRKSKILEFLETEFNKTLGWGLFSSKKPLKRDICFSLTLSSDELKSLDLKPGKNDVVFRVEGLPSQLEASIYLWEETDKIVISDIDGTITKSDVRGHLFNLVGKDWTHSGIAPLYSKIVKNGYKIVYLTSRSLVQSYSTKNYLKTVSQNDCNLPDGPTMHNPTGLFDAIYKEVIIKRPELFKIECLDKIKSLFNGKNPYVAGFGNRLTDVLTYKTVGVSENRIYTINEAGQIQAEYSKTSIGTYHTINEFIDSIFPPVNLSDNLNASYVFSDFRWWR